MLSTVVLVVVEPVWVDPSKISYYCICIFYFNLTVYQPGFTCVVETCIPVFVGDEFGVSSKYRIISKQVYGKLHTNYF